MSRFVALVRRELGVYFYSPIAYVILTGMLFVTGFMFFFGNVKPSNDMRIPFQFDQTLYLLVWIVIFICPWVTARLLAEEKNTGTLETLMTAPVSELQVVLAKFLSAMVFIAYLLLPTLAYVALIYSHADIDLGAIVTGYCGVLLAAAWIVSIGMFISSLCRNQMTAGILTLLASMGLFLIAIIPSLMPEELWVKEFLEAVNLVRYTEDFLRGVVDSRQLVVGFSVILFFLYQTVVALGSRRWR
jgi:ABC-2 type transport system permease protein